MKTVGGRHDNYKTPNPTANQITSKMNNESSFFVLRADVSDVRRIDTKWREPNIDALYTVRG